MKKYLLLFSFPAFILLSLQSYSQWQMSEGLEGGSIKKMVSIDSVLIAIIENRGVYKKISDQPWELCNSELEYRTIVKAGSCVFLIGYYADDYCIRSCDYGESWEPMPQVEYEHRLYSIDSVLFEYEFCYWMRSFDYGASFDTVHFPVTDMWFANLFSADSLLIALFEEEVEYEIFVSDNYGDSWDSITLEGIDFANNIDQIAFLNEQYWLQSSNGAPGGLCPFDSLYVFDQDFQEWVNVTLNLPGCATYSDLIEFNEQILCSIKTYPVFTFNTQDSSWLEFADGSKSVNRFVMHQDELYCATEQGLCSLDTNGNWTRHYQGLSNRKITSLSEFHDTLYLTASNELFYSTDAGDSFFIMDGGWGKQILCTDSVFYLITDHEFKMSFDQGESWVNYSDNLNNEEYDALLNDMCITNDWYYIGSNSGLFRTSVDSIKWELLDSEPNAPVRIQKVESIDSSLLIGTSWTFSWLLYSSYDLGDSFMYMDDIVGRIDMLDQNYYRMLDSIYYTNKLEQGWNAMPFIEGCIPRGIDKKDDFIAISGFQYQPGYLPCDEYRIYISVDSGQHWQNITANLPLTPENWVMDELFVKIIDNRLFIWDPDYGLWYRDDLLTGNPESKSKQTSSKYIVKVFPNPVKVACTFQLKMDQPCPVQLKIYNQYGKLVRTIVDELPQGHSQIPFSTKGLSPGAYLLHMQAGCHTANTKFVVL